MAERLTSQQMQVVTDRGGRLLVSAAAGSGKTKVLVDRLLRYLTDPVDPANIDDFLMITYTKAAASELRSKIAAKLSERVAQDPQNAHLQRQQQRLYLAKISTVHSFCGDILREYAFRLNLPGDFRVADEDECGEIRSRVMEKLLSDAYEQQMEDEAFRAFVDSQGLGRDDRQVPQIVMQVYDSARCHLEPEQWLSHCQSLTDTRDMTDAGQTKQGQYLIEQFHLWLDQQISVMTVCVEKAAADGLEKPVAVLNDDLYQLQRLRAADSWEQIRAAQAVEFGRLIFPKNCDEEVKMGIKAVRDACKSGLKKRLLTFADPSVQVLQDLGASALATQGLIDLVRAFARGYEAAKQSRRILDFGDLEHKMLDLLLGKSRTGPTAAAGEIGDRFREVMVDEYQDSNAVQDAIYGALTDRRKNLFMVGDVKQSIYQFRLADPSIFLKKYHNFVPADQVTGNEDRKVVLSKNFRSSAGVLEGCNDVFRLCMSPRVGGMYYGADEALYEGLEHVPLGEPEVELHCIQTQEQTYPEEAAFVAGHIQQLLRTGKVRDGGQLRPVRPEDIAILLRAPGSAGGYFQQALEACGIGCASGSGGDLLKTEEVQTLYSVLQVIYNPRLDIPLVAALLSPAFGFTADDLAAVRGGHKLCAFYDALRRDESEKSQTFVQTLQRLRGAMGQYSLTELLEQVLLETALEEVYGAMENGQTRLDNIQTFFQLAVDFEAAGNRDLGRFLEHLQAMEERGLMAAGEQQATGRVTIMSIHKSKGLEFPVVYLCNLGREFNLESQRSTVLCHREMGLGLSAVDHENRLRYPTLAKRAIAAQIGDETRSEELRVLYVAMTRARDRLIMTYTSKRLDKELTETVQRLGMGSLSLLTQEAMCPGDWVLMTALQKTEAGELFALAGAHGQTGSSAYPWKIQVHTGRQLAVTGRERAEYIPDISRDVLKKMEEGLSFRYGHLPATSAPSKLTATGLKGRYKDEEAAEQTPRPPLQRQWRQPRFGQAQMEGRDYGNAIHAVMQYIDYTACGSLAGVEREIIRLRDQDFISKPQADAVDARAIAAFFASDLGQKLRQGQVVREFKFSIMQDAAVYDEALCGEQMLLQGVVDCALLEKDGITIIDFKTDYVTDATMPQKLRQYAPQVEAYAGAMARIYQLPVKQRLLYFFHTGQFVRV